MEQAPDAIEVFQTEHYGLESAPWRNTIQATTSSSIEECKLHRVPAMNIAFGSILVSHPTAEKLDCLARYINHSCKPTVGSIGSTHWRGSAWPSLRQRRLRRRMR